MSRRRDAVMAVLMVALAAMVCAAAWGQETPKTSATQKATSTQAAPKTPASQMDLTLGLGWQHQSVGGNERYFDRYVTPPARAYVSQVLWEQLDYRAGTMFSARAQDLGEPGPAASLWLYTAGVNLDADYRKSTFYSEYDPMSGRTRRRDYSALLTPDVYAGRSNVWSLGLSDVALDGAPSTGPVSWEDRNHSASYGLVSHNTWFDFSFNREDFDLRTGSGLSGDTQSYTLSISPAVDQRTQISGCLARNVTRLDNFGSGVRSWDANVTALYPVTDTLDLTGQIRRFSIDQTITRNAYARQQLTGRVDAEYRLRPGTTLAAYYENAETNYLDGLQRNDVGVGSNTEGLAIRSRLTRALKVTGKYTRYDTRNQPQYYKIDDSFGSSVIYSTLKRLDLSATYAPRGMWGLTGDFQRHDWDNDNQAISNSLKTCALTGWWQALRGSLSMTASFMRQDFSLPQVDLSTQRGYASHTESWVLGANYTLSRASALYANYADVNTYGATANELRRLTIGATRDLGHGNHALAEANFGNYADDLSSDLNYDADLYRLEVQHKF